MFLKLKYTFILFFIIMSFFSNFNQDFNSNNSYIYPTTSRNITSNFGYRILFGKTNFHDGIDFAIPNGSPIYATNSGIIITSSFLNGYGNSIIIKHYDGNKSLYGHLSENFIVQNGDSVEQGEINWLCWSKIFIKRYFKWKHYWSSFAFLQLLELMVIL